MEKDFYDKKLQNWGGNCDEEDYLEFHCGYENEKKGFKIFDGRYKYYFS